MCVCNVYAWGEKRKRVDETLFFAFPLFYPNLYTRTRIQSQSWPKQKSIIHEQRNSAHGKNVRKVQRGQAALKVCALNIAFTPSSKHTRTKSYAYIWVI